MTILDAAKEISWDDYKAKIEQAFTPPEIERTGTMIFFYDKLFQIIMTPIVATKGNPTKQFTHFACSYPYSLAHTLARGDLIAATERLTARGIRVEFHEAPSDDEEARFVVMWPLLDFLAMADSWADPDADGFTIFTVHPEYGAVCGTIPEWR
jgi:hypothetical protein